MKTIYLTFIFHGNMNYDRYNKREIRKKFPDIYRIVVQDLIRYPHLRGQIQLSGMTIKSLQKVAPDVLEGLRNMAKKNQIVFTGTYYSEPVNVCIDGETDLACAWLGTEIVRKEIGIPSGFFPQEQSYHPQLPWILTELGLSWVTVFDSKTKQFRPYELRGLDGTKIIGIPSISFQRTKDLEGLYNQAEDKFLYTLVGDFEQPPDLEEVVAKVSLLNKKGKRIEFITIPEYLRRFGTYGERYYSACSWTDGMESPDFARWVSDPHDIEVHHFTSEAMLAIKHARLTDSILQKVYGEKADCKFEEIKTALIEDPSTYDIEKACEFPDIEEEYLSRLGEITLLSKAEHLLLWGVNSDARGWFPLIERRRERINSFINARILCEELIYRAMSKIARRIKFPRGREQAERIILLFNPLNKRKYDLEFRLGQPYGIHNWLGDQLPTINYLQGGEWVTQTTVPLPAYGYTTIYLNQTSKWNKIDFREGTVIKNENIELRLEGDEVAVFIDTHKFRIALDRYAIKETIRGMPAHRRTPIKSSEPMAKVRKGLYPQLRIYKQLDWGIHWIALYTLKGKDICCEYEFDFTKPTFIMPSGESGGSLGWDPRGLIVSIKADESGDIYYDIPYATCKHENSELSFVTALRFSLLQAKQRGVAIIAQSGSQSFKCHAKEGELGICLGASTIGGPAEPSWCDVIPEKRQIIHHDGFEEEMFFGKYKHRFVIHPYEGDWQKEDIPSLAKQITEKAYMYTVPTIEENQASEPAEQIFLELSPSNLELTNIICDKKGKLKVRFYETQGKKTKVKLRMGKEVAEKEASPNGISSIII